MDGEVLQSSNGRVFLMISFAACRITARRIKVIAPSTVQNVAWQIFKDISREIYGACMALCCHRSWMFPDHNAGSDLGRDGKRNGLSWCVISHLTDVWHNHVWNGCEPRIYRSRVTPQQCSYLNVTRVCLHPWQWKYSRGLCLSLYPGKDTLGMKNEHPYQMPVFEIV